MSHAQRGVGPVTAGMWTHFDDLGDRVYRIRTPVVLYALDRWLRGAEFVFDWIEWRFPRTSRLTRIPCTLYGRWAAIRAKYEVHDVFALAEWEEMHPATPERASTGASGASHDRRQQEPDGPF